MAVFSYDAINAQGLESSGDDPRARPHATHASSSQARGLLPQRCARRPQPASRALGTAFKKVKPKSLQIFSRQLATMIEAGVSVVAALVTLEEQTDDKYLREVIAEVRSDVESGVDPVQGARAASEGVQPPVRRDGRGGRVVGNPRHRARPDRDPDREGDEDQAPRQERDDLPDRRAHLRDARSRRSCCSSSCRCS